MNVNIFLQPFTPGRLTGAQRRQIEVLRDRIYMLDQKKEKLLQQPDSPSRRNEINGINNDIARYKQSLTRIYSEINFHPMDINLL